jgi:sporulation protein YlmC with PRC-barrel domain
MKKTLKWIACCSVCAMTGTAALAQSEYPELLLPTARETNALNRTTQSDERNEGRAEQQKSSRFHHAKNLVGADVKDSSGTKLGDVSDLLINPQTGEVFASIEVSGNRYALVPVQALRVTAAEGLLRNAEVTLNSTRQALESGPTIARNEWQKLDSSTFTQTIYSHYRVQQPSAMGGAADSSMGGTSGGSSLHGSTNKPPRSIR